jgi:hypothetical protein
MYSMDCNDCTDVTKARGMLRKQNCLT